MLLITMAHRGEAQEFIKQLSLKPEKNNTFIFKNDSVMLLLTGEGPYEVFTKLPYVIGKYEVDNIINLGIAGSLNKDLEINKIYPIRTSYSYSNKPRFESFTTKTNSLIDCITTDERVLSDSYASQLKPFAQIVDRELWAIAKVAKQFDVPLHAYKLISDIAGDTTQCFDLKQRAKEFSNLMFDFYKNINYQDHNYTRDEEIQDKIQLPFHASFTQYKRIEKLLAKLDSNQELLITEFSNVNSNELNDKNKANNFISFLENKINPINKIIDEHFQKELEALKSCGAKVIYDKKLDSKKITLHFEINSEKNIEKLIQALSKTNYSNIQNIWEGKINV